MAIKLLIDLQVNYTAKLCSAHVSHFCMHLSEIGSCRFMMLRHTRETDRQVGVVE